MAPSARRVPGWIERRLALGGLVVLIAAGAMLAAAGPDAVPAGRPDPPGWLEGVFGAGLGLSGGACLVLLGIAFAAYLLVLRGAPHLRPRTCFAAISSLLLVFALAPPLFSQDVFSYVSYARLAAHHGLDPYVSTPTSLPTDAAFQFVGWRHAVSAYGPLFTLTSLPLGLVGVPAALWSMKALSAAAVGLSAWLTSRAAPVRGVRPAYAAAFVGLNPLVLAHVVGGAHNDGFMVALLCAGTMALLAGSAMAGGAALAGAVAVKTSAAFALPFALIGSGHRRQALAGAAAAAALIAAVAIAVWGTDFLSALSLIGENQSRTSHYSVPAQVSRLTGLDVDLLRTVAAAGYGVAVAWLLRWTWGGGDWIRATGWAAVGLLIATSWLLPWYVIWALPFVALARDRALAGAALGLCAFQLVNRIPL